MRKLFLTCGLVVAGVAASPAAAVFDTFGPGNTYSQNLAFVVSGPSSSLGNTFESAAKFIAAAGGTLSQVNLGLTVSDGGSVNVYLYGDASGSPDNLSQILLGNVTPSQAFGSTTNSVVSVTPAGNVTLNGGTTYWLVLKPATATTNDRWNQSVTTSGVQMVAHGDGNWVQSNTQLAAFRVTTVPEPGAFALTLVGLLILGATRRRRVA